MNLKPGEKILSAHDIMLYKEPNVQVHRRTIRSLGVSMGHLMGIKGHGGSEEDYYFAEYEGPGNVTFSRDKSGEVRVLQLSAGQTVRLRSGHLICFDESVRYYPMILTRYYVQRGGKQEIEYLVADELTGPGTIIFQSYGNVLTFQLGQGERLRTSVDGLLLSSSSVGVNVVWMGNSPSFGFSGNWAIPVMDVNGPGQVMVHSGL